VHQVNLEYLARVIFSQERDGVLEAFPDTLVGTDSHTTMINTDLVLTIVEMLRRHGVVGKFVEFYGDGLDIAPPSPTWPPSTVLPAASSPSMRRRCAIWN